MAVAASGKMYAWGRGTNGQLGTGETGDQNTPQLVEVLSKGSICMDALQGLSNAGQGVLICSDRALCCTTMPPQDGCLRPTDMQWCQTRWLPTEVYPCQIWAIMNRQASV